MQLLVLMWMFLILWVIKDACDSVAAGGGYDTAAAADDDHDAVVAAGVDDHGTAGVRLLLL